MKKTQKSTEKAPSKPKKKYVPVFKSKKDKFVPEPKDANTVNAIREELRKLREYKMILAQDGLKPDLEDKERESELIKQLIRIEKGLTPKKKPAKKKPKVGDKKSQLTK